MTPDLLIRLLLAALAAYRLARMMAWEDGPFDAFSRLRGRVDPAQRTWVGRGLNCPLCVGFWVSPVMLTISYVEWLIWVVGWLAVAGLQTWLQRFEGD
jgi:hypothetical protein